MKLAIKYFPLLLFLGVCNAETKIVDVQGYYMAFYKGQYREIFRLPDNSWSYGFGLVSEDIAVFTHQDPKAAFSRAIVKFVNLEDGKTIYTLKVHGAGESSFQFNGSRGVFNDSEGVKIIDFKNLIAEVTVLKDLISKDAFAPFWIDENTIGYSYYKDSNLMFARINAPPS